MLKCNYNIGLLIKSSRRLEMNKFSVALSALVLGSAMLVGCQDNTAQLQSQIQNLSNKVDNLASQIDALKSDVQAAQASADNANSRLDNLATRYKK